MLPDALPAVAIATAFLNARTVLTCAVISVAEMDTTAVFAGTARKPPQTLALRTISGPQTKAPGPATEVLITNLQSATVSLNNKDSIVR